MCQGVGWIVTLNCQFGCKKFPLVELLYVQIRSATQLPNFSQGLITSTVLCIGRYPRLLFQSIEGGFFELIFAHQSFNGCVFSDSRVLKRKANINHTEGSESPCMNFQNLFYENKTFDLDKIQNDKKCIEVKHSAVYSMQFIEL